MKAHEIISKIKAKLFSQDFKDSHKINPQDFVRRSTLNFVNLTVLILNGVKKSLQVELFSLKKFSLPTLTKQAFSKARKKISTAVFIDLNYELIHQFYRENQVKKWRGFVVYANDGSKLQVPDNNETRQHYGAAINRNSSMTMGIASHIYDVLNGITVAAEFAPLNISEKDLLYSLLKDLKNIKEKCNQEKILLLLDRGFPGYVLFFLCQLLGIDFLARCKKDFSNIIEIMLASGEKDKIITYSWEKLNCRQKRDLNKLGINLCDLKSMKLRILIVDLKNGEKEYLITSLIDQDEFEYECFSELYFMRWSIEENYKFYKVRIEIENFSGMSIQAIEQDFYATILSSNIRSLIANEAQDKLKKNKNPKKRCDYKINKNISMGALKDEILKMLFNPKSNVKRFCDEIKRNMTMSATAIRPLRNYERKKKRTCRKYHMNQRRCY